MYDWSNHWAFLATLSARFLSRRRLLDQYPRAARMTPKTNVVGMMMAMSLIMRDLAFCAASAGVVGSGGAGMVEEELAALVMVGA